MSFVPFGLSFPRTFTELHGVDQMCVDKSDWCVNLKSHTGRLEKVLVLCDTLGNGNLTLLKCLICKMHLEIDE